MSNLIYYKLTCPDDRNCTVKTDDGQITTHDRIRQMLDRKYKKNLLKTRGENTIRKC